MTFYVRGHPIGWLSVYSVIVSTISGMTFGYDMGYSASILIDNDALLRFATDHKNCTWEPDGAGGDGMICVPIWKPYIEGVLVGMLSIGCLIGALLSPYLADWIGRKKAIQIECLFFFAGVIVQGTSQWAWVQFTVGRLVAGLGVGALSAIVPPYISELVPKDIRGISVAAYQGFIFFGILLGYIFDIAARNVHGRLGTTHRSASWRIPVCLALVFGLALFIGVFFCPESPRFDALHGREHEVRKTIARTRGLKAEDLNPIVEAEASEIMANAAKERASPAGFIDCFRPKDRVLYRTLLCCMLQVLQQLAGANYFYYFGAQVLKPLGLQDSLVTQIIFGAVSVGCEIPGLYILEFVGRRRPLIIGSFWMSIWMFVYAIAGTVGNKGSPDKPEISKEIGTLMVVSACFGLLGYAATWAPGVWLVCGETGATRTRAKQSALAAFTNWTWNFLLAFFTTPITANIGFAYGFVFAGVNLFSCVFTTLFLYETKGLTLEQIGIMYNDPKCKPWTSVGWQPPESLEGSKKDNQLASDDEHKWSVSPGQLLDEMPAIAKGTSTKDTKTGEVLYSTTSA